MNKFRKILLGLLISCFAVCTCLGVVACTKRKDYPDYINTGIGDAYKDRYLVSVTSAGGLPLNDVRISAKKDGITKMSGVSVNGKIEFTLPADEYELAVDESSLPLGYYLDDTVYKTTKENAKVTVSILSTVIPTTAVSGTKYNVGDIMYNFGFTDTAGVKHTLSDVLATKKAVMLNFWYTTCNPCRNEFPAVQSAYEAFADKLSIIALSGQDSMEGDNGIIKFREDYGISFYMGQDQAGLINLFDVQGYPTTVIVDRYGVIVHRESGGKFNESYWRALFATYTSEDYTQSGNQSGNDNGDAVEFAKPESFDQPTTEEYLAAIGGTGASGKVSNFTPTTNEKDAPYSFPWLIGEDSDGKYVYASNSKIHYSFATLIFDVSLENGDVLIWDYKICTEENDVLYVYINNTNHGNFSGTGGGWQTDYAYIASREVKLTITLLYLKDLKDNDPDDLVCLKNIRIAKVTDLDLGSDQQISVTDGLKLSSNNSYNISNRLIAPTGVNGDIYYRYEFDDNGTTKRAILLADILQPTAWSDKFVGDNTFYVPDQAANYNSSLYDISFWTMSNYKIQSDTVPLLFSYTSSAAANRTHTDTIVEKYYLQKFSDNGLVPVTEKLKNALTAFTKAYCDKNNKNYYEDQWLELCYYYRHYGDDHIIGNCSMTDDPVKGLVWENALTATTGKNEVNITKEIQNDGGGLCYIFKPQTSGIYHFYSIFKDLVDPRIYIFGADNFETPLAEQNDDKHYDFFTRPNYEYWNFNLYVPLKAGETYYVRAAMGSSGAKGEYNMYIEYYSNEKEIKNLVVASYDGTWKELTKYNAIPVALSYSDGYFHEVTASNDYGSVIYIDFVHPNFFDINDNSLLDLINVGRFDFRNYGGRDYTQAMKQYYYKSIANKNTGDELYGLIEADLEIVNMISELIYYTYGDGIESGAWLMFGCYYETIVCNFD